MRPALASVIARNGVLIGGCVLAVTTASACGGAARHGTSSTSANGSGTNGSGAPGTAAVVRVPADAPTITTALGKARPGGLILVSPGTYHEQVTVTTPRITLRGLERNTVIVDGDVIRPNAIAVHAAGVAIENLTVRNATQNGVFVSGSADSPEGGRGYSTEDPAKTPPVQGFLVDHVTSYNNGGYGIYAFNAQHGVIENSYTSGMPDSGIYVGQCKPCDIAVRGNVAERNAVGYEGTNASQQMYVYGNRFVGNRVGATINADHQEALLPQLDDQLIGNVVAANSTVKTPEQAEGGFGVGIGITGGTMNTVGRNLVAANPVAGVEITSGDDLAPIGNQIIGNRFAGNRLDVVYAATSAAPGHGNCLSGNDLRSVLPPTLPTHCPVSDQPYAGASFHPPAAPGGVDFSSMPAPPSLPNLPDAATRGPSSAAGLPGPVDLAAVAVPAPTLLAEQSTVRW